LLQQCYAFTGIDESEELLAEDVSLFRQLRQDGYSTVDIEYAVKWTVWNIPSVKASKTSERIAAIR